MEQGEGSANMRSRPSRVLPYFKKVRSTRFHPRNQNDNIEWEYHCISCEEAGHPIIYFIGEGHGLGILTNHLKRKHGITFQQPPNN